MDYVSKYILNFLKQLFENVGNIQYPGKNEDIPRPNHGTLNHLRSFKFGLWFIKTIIESKPEIKMELFPDNKFLVMILLSTMFESIMRIDEKGSFPILIKVTEKYFDKLYPNLNYAHFASIQMSPHKIASSIFYKLIMTECFDYPPAQIEELALVVAFHWDETTNINTININNLKLSDINKNNYLKFFIYYTIIMFGHYTDHCRCNWIPPPSQGVNGIIFQKVFEIFDIQDDEQVKIVKIVLHSLVNTEYERYIGGNSAINDISNHKDMMNLCYSKLDKRYGNKFKYFSKNFNEAIGVLEIENDIKNFFQM